MIFAESTDIINETALYGNKITADKLQDPKYVNKLTDIVVNMTESDFKRPGIIKTLIKILGIISVSVITNVVVVSAITYFTVVIVLSMLKHAVIPSSDKKKLIKVLDKIITKLESDPELAKGNKENINKLKDAKKKLMNESYTEGVNMDNEVLCFSGNNGGSYIQDALYESYIQAKIDSEERLALALKESMIISEADYSNIKALHEAKFSDKAKSTWKRFVAFIKGLVAKFMESMSNILLDEKAYLEKYKDIILKKRPKDDMKFSYTGDYEEGIKRLIKVEIPLFEYYKYKTQLEAEGDGDLVKALMGAEFKYDDGVALSEQFKNYFLAVEKGEKEGKFSDLNMTDMYNFCYNFKKIKDVVDKDINRLEQSTKNIESAINKSLAATNNDAAGDNATNQATNQTSNTTSNTQSSTTENKNESTVLSEKVEIKDEPTSVAASKMGSTQNADQKDEDETATAGSITAVNDGKKAEDITKAADKWVRVCRPIIASKLTAYQQIAKDYMDIIRAHVRSYGGQDKKSKEGNKAPQTATQYSKHPEVNQAKQDAENAAKEAENKK